MRSKMQPWERAVEGVCPHWPLRREGGKARMAFAVGSGSSCEKGRDSRLWVKNDFP